MNFKYILTGHTLGLSLTPSHFWSVTGYSCKMIPHLLQLSQDVCTVIRTLLGNFAVLLGNSKFKNSNDNLTMKKPKTGKTKIITRFNQDSKPVFQYEIGSE